MSSQEEGTEETPRFSMCTWGECEGSVATGGCRRISAVTRISVCKGEVTWDFYGFYNTHLF